MVASLNCAEIKWGKIICLLFLAFHNTEIVRAMLENKTGPSVQDQQLLVRTSNFLHISLQIIVSNFQNSDRDQHISHLSPED